MSTIFATIDNQNKEEKYEFPEGTPKETQDLFLTLNENNIYQQKITEDFLILCSNLLLEPLIQ